MKTPITPTLVHHFRQTASLLRSSRQAGYIALVSLTIALQATLLLLVSLKTAYQFIAVAIASILFVLMFLVSHRLGAMLNRSQLVALFAALVQAIGQFATLGGTLNQAASLMLTAVTGCMVLACVAVILIELFQLMHAERWASVFTSLSEVQLAALAARAERVTFRARSILFRQDAAADRIYLITRGEVEVLQRDTQGVYAPLAQVGSGAWIGEAGLLSHTAHRTAAKAISEVEALALDREVLASLLFGSVEVVALLPTSLANELPARILTLRTGIQRLTPANALYLLGSALGSQSYQQALASDRLESSVGSSKTSAA